MCGIFGILAKKKINLNELNQLASHSQQRGKDSSGLIYFQNNNYIVKRADFNINKLLKSVKPEHTNTTVT